MLSDDDIISLMKSYRASIPHFDEWFSRQYKYFPIWKTYSEMKAFLGKELSTKIMTDEGKVYKEMEDYLKKRLKVDVFSLKATPSIKEINKEQVYILFGNNKVVDFTELGLAQERNVYAGQTFMYVFVEKKNNLTREKLCIEPIKDFANNMDYR